jgi:hypothetical protein
LEERIMHTNFGRKIFREETAWKHRWDKESWNGSGASWKSLKNLEAKTSSEETTWAV